MDQPLVRLFLLLKFLVPFVLFMAVVYLALHMLFARLLTGPQGPTLWFFGVVTRPLTQPVRAFLAPATPEPRVRVITLGVYIALWLAARFILNAVFG